MDLYKWVSKCVYKTEMSLNIYSFIHIFIYLSIYFLIYFLFIYWFFLLFVYASIYLFIYLFIHLFIYVFIHSFIHSFIYLLKALFLIDYFRLSFGLILSFSKNIKQHNFYVNYVLHCLSLHHIINASAFLWHIFCFFRWCRNNYFDKIDTKLVSY